tara:strand:+ start:1336 stop:1818 length:483 start_codon:yes stop_codon:yes gene_type:complete
VNAEIIFLRLLHIVPGVIWVGGIIFFAFVLQPALSKTGSEHFGPVMQSLVKPMQALLHSSAWMTIIFGLAMAFRVRDPLFDFLWSTNWGIAIVLGFVTALVGYGLGVISGRYSKKIISVSAVTSQDPEARDLQNRAMMFSKMSALFVVLSVVTMAIAQHI